MTYTDTNTTVNEEGCRDMGERQDKECSFNEEIIFINAEQNQRELFSLVLKKNKKPQQLSTLWTVF